MLLLLLHNQMLLLIKLANAFLIKQQNYKLIFQKKRHLSLFLYLITLDFRFINFVTPQIKNTQMQFYYIKLFIYFPFIKISKDKKIYFLSFVLSSLLSLLLNKEFLISLSCSCMLFIICVMFSSSLLLNK